MSSTDNPLGAQPITVYMTASTFDEARKIASALVDSIQKNPAAKRSG